MKDIPNAQTCEMSTTVSRFSRSKPPKPKLRIIKELGRGCFGVVFQALLEHEPVLDVAWKRMHKNSRKQSREFEMLEMLKGELHCVQLIDFFYSFTRADPERQRVIQNFILELCDDNLESLLSMKNKHIFDLTYLDCKKIVFQILLGLKSLHDRRICHRDLKPENIFYSRNVIKVGDLGSAKCLVDFESNTPYVVSRYYRAPELILGIKVYSLNIDIFSVGVIFYELVTGHLPFKGKTEGHQLIEIIRHLGPPPKDAQELYRILIGWHGTFKKTAESKEGAKSKTRTPPEKSNIGPDLKTIPRNSKIRKIDLERVGDFESENKENKSQKNEICNHKRDFLKCKDEVLQKSQISPLWNDDLELLFKIKPHRDCFEKLKLSRTRIRNPEAFIK